jgi:5-methylcytosine-specific restriction endonuclease McrA
MKRCTGCGQEKPIEEFHRSRAARDGHTPRCKVCNNAASERRRKTSPEAVKASYRKWYIEKGYRNTDRRIERSREWRRQHPERMRHLRQQWAAANQDRLRIYRRKRRDLHPDVSRVKRHRERARKHGAKGKVTFKDLQGLRQWFGNRCAACGADGPLALDHIIPLSHGGDHRVENLQFLCVPCHDRKGCQHTDYRNREVLNAFLAARQT